jgi:hypothetical protein
MGKTIEALFKSGDDGRLLSAIEDAVMGKWAEWLIDGRREVPGRRVRMFETGGSSQAS